MTQTCSSHTDRPATHRCDGCQRGLCGDCIKPSSSLLLCSHCGELALPLGGEAPSTVQEQLRQSTIASTSDYGFSHALAYPFRGSGLFMFFAGLIALFFIGFLRMFGIGCIPFIIWLGWLTLLAGVQFKIVKSTAGGDNELPDWPEYFSFGERLVEFMTWLVVVFFLQYGPLVLYLMAMGGKGLLTSEPSLLFWIGAAACMWMGAALAIMGFGAAGVHWKHQCLRIDLHIRGLIATGGDALLATNFTFVLFSVVFVARAVLGGSIPIVGAMASGIVGLYWAFLEPHFAGILFRRHAKKLHEIYEGNRL